MVKSVLIFLFAISLCSCDSNKTDSAAAVVVDSLGDGKITPKFDERIKELVDYYCSKYDTVLIVYHPVCWSSHCSPKGYVYYKWHSNYYFVAYRLKKIYQILPYKDTVVRVGNLLESSDLHIDDLLSKTFEKSIIELDANEIPLTGSIAISHEDTIYIWYKQNDNVKSAITLNSTIYFDTVITHLNVHNAFWQADTMLLRLFKNGNNDTLR